MATNFRKPSMKHDDYLAYVRAQPCVGCGVWGQQQAHHNIADRFSSAKADDANSLPLCAPCHTKLHANWPEWEAAHGSQWMHAMQTLLQAIRDGVWVLDRKAAKALSNGMGNP